MSFRSSSTSNTVKRVSSIFYFNHGFVRLNLLEPGEISSRETRICNSSLATSKEQRWKKFAGFSSLQLVDGSGTAR